MYIQDPHVTRPLDWVDVPPRIPDPTHFKPEGYDDIPEEVPGETHTPKYIKKIEYANFISSEQNSLFTCLTEMNQQNPLIGIVRICTWQSCGASSILYHFQHSFDF